MKLFTIKLYPSIDTGISRIGTRENIINNKESKDLANIKNDKIHQYKDKIYKEILDNKTEFTQFLIKALKKIIKKLY